MQNTNLKKTDWHLMIAALSIILTISSVVVGCYISLSNRLTVIETTLLLKGIMPQELITSVNEE